MADVKEIPPWMVLPVELQHLRVAAYCRVSTEQEKQDSSLELQQHYYRTLIDRNLNWENAGIFSEKATGLNIEERKAGGQAGHGTPYRPQDRAERGRAGRAGPQAAKDG